jgi:hypothetical protein
MPKRSPSQYYGGIDCQNPMPKFPHDDFSKTYLTELLSVIGKAIPNRPLKAETHFADLWFELDPKLASQRPKLGLLGELLDRDTASSKSSEKPPPTRKSAPTKANSPASKANSTAKQNAKTPSLKTISPTSGSSCPRPQTQSSEVSASSPPQPQASTTSTNSST